ncbi:MAG: serine/threonine protein kinase, partial [Synechococcales bacterium]|nr:serine/threonine protein kinase [Synechococcales bacterium]
TSTPPVLREMQRLTDHTAAVRAIAFSPNGECLATAGDDRTIRLWDPRSGHCLRVLAGHPWVISSLAFSEDGELLVSGSWDATVKVWEVRSGKELAILVGHTDCITDLVVTKNMILSSSRDRTIKQWNLIQ